jgi:hypothetical protein
MTAQVLVSENRLHMKSLPSNSSPCLVQGSAVKFNVLYSIYSYASDMQIVYIRFEVFMAMTMKNAIFRDVMLSGSCKN